MHEFHRFVLAQELLAGDEDARLILADLLSEDGDEELADFAREPRRINQKGDLQLAIRLLPVSESLSLGCEMLDRGMYGKGTVRRHAWLLAQLARIRRLIRKRAAPAQLMAEGRALANYRVAAATARDDHCLQDAAQSLGSALELVESSHAVGLAIVSVAGSMVHRVRYLDELQWQVERTGQVFGKLVAAMSNESAAAVTDSR